MAEFKGTKGKWNWIYKSGFIKIIDEQFRDILDIFSKKEKEANAKLITAAPDLLEALIQLKNKYGEYSDVGKIAIEAIKKATE